MTETRIERTPEDIQRFHEQMQAIEKSRMAKRNLVAFDDLLEACKAACEELDGLAPACCQKLRAAIKKATT